MYDIYVQSIIYQLVKKLLGSYNTLDKDEHRWSEPLENSIVELMKGQLNNITLLLPKEDMMCPWFHCGVNMALLLPKEDTDEMVGGFTM